MDLYKVSPYDALGSKLALPWGSECFPILEMGYVG